MKTNTPIEDVAVGKPAKEAKTPSPKKPTTAADDLFDRMLASGATVDDAEQSSLDHSITKDLMGRGPIINGVEMRPLSLAMVMLLHEIGNEIMIGKSVGQMTNPLMAAGEFLFACNAQVSLDEITDLVFNRRAEFKKKVIEFCDAVPPTDSLILDVIAYINDATSTRVNAELPSHMQSSGGPSDEPLGND
jgi:hypothetical protein